MISKNEFLWREWVLGEERFEGKGPRSRPRPNFGYGGPGQSPVPKAWWRRLEAFLTKRDDHREQPLVVPPMPIKYPAQRESGETFVSPHFRLSEFNCHNGVRVPTVAVPALVRLCRDVLEPIREVYGVVFVTSGYRTVAYNRSIGGVPQSQHIYEWGPESVAADIIPAHGSPRAWAELANRLLGRSGGLGVYEKFIHVDNRATRARW